MGRKKGWKKGRFDFSDIFGPNYNKNTDDISDDTWDEDDNDDDIPEGCTACGGDWPRCTTSCPLYDD